MYYHTAELSGREASCLSSTPLWFEEKCEYRSSNIHNIHVVYYSFRRNADEKTIEILKIPLLLYTLYWVQDEFSRRTKHNGQ